MWFSIPTESPEISDEIVLFDEQTLRRSPVRRRDVISRFEGLGNHQAARVSAAIAHRGDYLDPEAVDRILITSHAEMQRISEEFQHGRRVRELLIPIVDCL